MFIRPITMGSIYSAQNIQIDNKVNNQYHTKPMANDSVSFSAKPVNISPLKAYEVMNNLKDAAKKMDVESIFKACGISVERNSDKTLTLSHFEQPLGGHVKFCEFGIDEDKLLENVKVIKGTADFRGSQLKHADKLVEAGELYAGSKLESLNSLEKVHKNFFLWMASKKFEHLDTLQKVGGELDVESGFVQTLNGLKEAGSINAGYSHLKEMRSLQKVKENLDVSCSDISELPSLKHCGGDVNGYLSDLSFADLKNAKIDGKIVL